MWGSGDIAINERRHQASSVANSSNAHGIYRLIGFVSFCLLIYKIWGPLLFITCALIVSLHLCYSLYVNDSLLSPYSLVLLGHARNLALELIQTLQSLLRDGLIKFKVLFKYLRKQYETRFKKQLDFAENDSSMGDGKKNLYRPSVLVNKNSADNTSPKNSEYYHTFALNGVNSIGKTSTPLPRGLSLRNNEIPNGNVNIITPTKSNMAKKVPALRNENRPTLNLSQTEDTFYNPKNTFGNHSMSPRGRDKSEISNTVQTVAGPLLNSFKYNIDPKLYTDINSPGFSSRLSKYAMDANNTLTHQPQYGPGQFPKVNLHASPIPILTPKVMKSRMPVIVRVAPPEINYSPVDSSSQQDQSKTYSPTEARESKSCPSVVQVLKKMAVKRQASREDIMLDLAKKQKADQEYKDQLENLEEMMQKRARDESATSDDEFSPQSSNQRPIKRSKSHSCHDVLHSLSSSVNVFTGIKRKAVDSPPSSSPDNEKHFKLSDASASPHRSSSLTLMTSKELSKSKEQLNVRVETAPGEPHQNKALKKSLEPTPQQNRLLEEQKISATLNSSSPKIFKETVSSKNENYVDKLFMKPEPPANEKLKSMIKEKGKIEAQFTTDDKDEIKKQDIDNMRQNSMRTRLKSMFNAISGKSESKIDPDVVIQAEEVNSPATTASFATLNSLTTTTTVNTSPITTTIVPILKTDSENKSLTASKHVTFNLPLSSFSSTSSSASTQSTISNTEAPKLTDMNTIGSSNSGESSAVTTSSTMFSFGNNNNKPTTSAIISSGNPASTSSFSLSTNSTSSVTTIIPTTSLTENKSQSSNNAITATLFIPKTTIDISSSSNSATTTAGLSFSTVAISKSTSPTPTFSFTPSSTMPSFSHTSPTSSAPSFSFNSNTTSSTAPTFSFNSNTSLTSARSSDSTSTSAPVLSFGNTSATNPLSNSFATPTTTTTTTTPTLISTNFNNPSSTMFNAPSTNSPFSINNVVATNSTALTATTAAAPTSVSSSFNFNSNSKPAAGGFSFNAPTPSTTTTTSATGFSTPSFNFSTGAQSNTNTVSGASTFAIPAISNASAPNLNSPPSLFNTPTNSSSLFSGTSTLGSSPVFKNPTAGSPATASVPSIFSSTSSGFGTTPASMVAATSATATTSAPSIFASAAPKLFGNVATTVISTASTISPFGVPATQPQQTGMFSGVNVTTPPSIFGSSAPASSLFAVSNPAAANATPPANSTEKPSIFGQSKPLGAIGGNTQTTGFPSPALNNPASTNSPAPAFPTSNNLPTFGKPMATFGAPASTSSGSVFGSPNSTNTSSVFGSTNPTNQSPFGLNAPSATFGPGSTFGSAAAQSSSTFGAGSISPPGTTTFGSGTSASSSAFGSGASASGSVFGSGAAASTGTFGSNAPTFGSGSSPFNMPNAPFSGAPVSTQAPSLFGNTPATSSTSGATFSFGGAQSTQQPTQQPSTAFNFGGASSAPPSGGMFQFGGTNDPKPAGFNFSAPTGAPSINFSSAAAPPAFNAPAPNMFSIGSGSSTPRSRTARKTGRQR